MEEFELGMGKTPRNHNKFELDIEKTGKHRIIEQSTGCGPNPVTKSEKVERFMGGIDRPTPTSRHHMIVSLYIRTVRPQGDLIGNRCSVCY